MKAINWTTIFEKYPGKWVALKSDHKTVVSSSEDAKKAYKEAKKKGIAIPFLFKVPKESLPYVGGLSSVK